MHDAEIKAYRDAYAIAWVGASNPHGVANAITETLKALRDAGVVDPVKHPTIRAMIGHLAFLSGDSIGPDIDVLRQVVAVHERNVVDSRDASV